MSITAEALPLDTLKCPVDEEILHFEQMHKIRLSRKKDDGKYYYDSWCPKCRVYRLVKARSPE